MIDGVEDLVHLPSGVMSAISFLGDHWRVKDDIDDGLAAPVSQAGSRSSKGRYRKPTLLHLAVTCVILLFVMYSLRSFTPAVFTKAFYGRPCFWKGMGSLPTYYILPSGDKIPSVALGKYSCEGVSVFLISILGVWKAGKDEVGNAVKVHHFPIH